MRGAVKGEEKDKEDGVGEGEEHVLGGVAKGDEGQKEECGKRRGGGRGRIERS
jgi:hypothetical protein